MSQKSVKICVKNGSKWGVFLLSWRHGSDMDDMEKTSWPSCTDPVTRVSKPFPCHCVWLCFSVFLTVEIWKTREVFPVGFSWSISTVGYLSPDRVPTDCLSGTKHSSKHDSEQLPIHQPVSHFSISLLSHLKDEDEKTVTAKCMSATKLQL